MAKAFDKRIDLSEARKSWSGIFDESTILSINKLMKKGFVKDVGGVAKEGKESIVLAGIGSEGYVAIKVYAVNASKFKRMETYIFGDKRFSKIKKDRRSVIFAWCRKEFSNLKLAFGKGVNCPEPLAFHNNVLVERFVGHYPTPAPRLSDCIHSALDWTELFKSVLEQMKKMNMAGIVHGDLSEYNMLYWEGNPWIIDLSQGVLLSHPDAHEFLERDVKNVCSFFRKLGVDCKETEAMSVIEND